jgi:hypothetical protein
MATQKQPRFPRPPLETGVAQYPTPLVPNYVDKRGGWGINDLGHIILVEKVSIEKGSFNPQPLDGSVTYTGRDANKWPSTLYLVAEKPTPDGEFIYRYWANDRSVSSQNLWNYNIAYSSEDTTKPIYTRSYIVPRSSYSPSSFTGTDPLNGSSYFVKLQMAELPEDNPLASRYVAVQAVYETLPGPVLTGYQYDPDLNLIVTNTKQTIGAGASAPSLTDGLLSSRDEPLDKWRTIRVQSKIGSLPASRTEYKTGSYASPNLITNYNISFLNTSNFETVTKVQPVMRAKRSYETVFKYVTSYQYGGSTPSYTLFDPLAVNVYVDTFLFQVSIPDALTDSYGPYTITTLPNNPTYGYISDTFQIAATTPNATQYLAIISSGIPKLISYELSYWKANIYRLSEVYVFLK